MDPQEQPASQSSSVPESREPSPSTELKAAADREANIPLWKDFLYFLIHNKKWWLLPIIIIVILLGFLMALSSTAIAPFIYTVF